MPSPSRLVLFAPILLLSALTIVRAKTHKYANEPQCQAFSRPCAPDCRRDDRLDGSAPIITHRNKDKAQCMKECLKVTNCQSFNWNRVSKDCELNSIRQADSRRLTNADNWSFYNRVSDGAISSFDFFSDFFRSPLTQ